MLTQKALAAQEAQKALWHGVVAVSAKEREYPMSSVFKKTAVVLTAGLSMFFTAIPGGAQEAAAGAPAVPAAIVFNPADHGAKGDGATLCTAAIQKAVDAAAAAGGGTVAFPKGVYLSGAIFLKSNVEFRLDEGVELRAIPDDAAYPERPTRIAGIETAWPAALVNVYEQRNVRIAGKGIIDGSGPYWWHKFWGEDHKGGMLADYKKRGLRWAVDYDCKRVRPLAIFKSADVAVKGITIRRAGFWSLTSTYSERITIDGVTIRNNIDGFGPSSDGIDIDSSRDVLIENCDIDCNDDNICLKAGRDADGLRVNRPTENVVIRNCITRAGGGMVTIGSETSGGIRNVEAYNLKAIGTSSGIRFKSAKVRGGRIEKIRFHDITMDDVKSPFVFDLNWYPSYSYPTIPAAIPPEQVQPLWKVLTQKVEPAERGIPEFRDISITNVVAKGADRAFAVNAYPEKPIHNLRWQKVTVQAKSAGSIKDAADWTMQDVVVYTVDGKPLATENLQRVELPVVKKAE